MPNVMFGEESVLLKQQMRMYVVDQVIISKSEGQKEVDITSGKTQEDMSDDNVCQ